jgi:regulator of sigma D
MNQPSMEYGTIATLGDGKRFFGRTGMRHKKSLQLHCGAGVNHVSSGHLDVYMAD